MGVAVGYLCSRGGHGTVATTTTTSSRVRSRDHHALVVCRRTVEDEVRRYEEHVRRRALQLHTLSTAYSRKNKADKIIKSDGESYRIIRLLVHSKSYPSLD